MDGAETETNFSQESNATSSEIATATSDEDSRSLMDSLSVSLSTCQIFGEDDDNDEDEILYQFAKDGLNYFRVKNRDGKSKTVNFDQVSKKLVHRYYLRIGLENFVDGTTKQELLFKKKELLFSRATDISGVNLNLFSRKFGTPRGLQLPPSNQVQIQELYDQLRPENEDPDYSDKEYATLLLELRKLLCIKKMLKQRKKQLLALENCIRSWSRLSDNRRPMKVVNNYDLEVLSHMRYINCWDLTGCEEVNAIFIAEGCSCTSECSPDRCSCIFENDIVPSYSDGRLSDEFLKTKVGNNFLYPIYECNEQCTCPRTCPNRLVQSGSDVDFVISRTFNDCGWGVRTATDIPRGAFVVRYTGELIGESKMAGRDGIYTFGLKYEEKNYDFIIDAEVAGNVSRFVNHSCQPNLGIVPVYTKFRDEKLYDVCFFALKPIRANEQLTINYGPLYILDCRCNKKKCRGPQKKK